MGQDRFDFGGSWTDEKLERVRKYLAAYVIALKRKSFELHYVDAFAGVAPNPLPLTNSRGNPLYLLCFACGNPKGCKPALDIATYILGQQGG